MMSHSMVSRARLLQVRFSMVNICSTSTSCDPFAPERIFSEDSKRECIRRLRLFKNPRPPPDSATKQAAVLVPLCLVGGEVCLLYTLRSPSLTTHRGQVSFPGGMKDESDENSEATAIRETEEELGISRQQIHVWASCSSPLSARQTVAVVPVIASVGEVDLENLKVNEQEVGEVFTIPLSHLCNPENFRFTQFRNGYIVPVYLGGKHRVWGLTAGITHIFLSSLLPSVYQRPLRPIKPIEIVS